MKPQLHRRKPTSISNRDRFAQETERNDSASQSANVHWNCTSLLLRRNRETREDEEVKQMNPRSIDQVIFQTVDHLAAVMGVVTLQTVVNSI